MSTLAALETIGAIVAFVAVWVAVWRVIVNGRIF